MLFAAVFALGWLLGLTGAGGAGVTITLLTVGFDVPVHAAIAVSLACMTCTVLSGTISHFREGDVLVRLGAVTGGAGMVGAFLGTRAAFAIPTALLSPILGGILLLSASILYVRLFHPARLNAYVERNKASAVGRAFYVRAVILGLGTGFLSGAFGIGSTAFIQIGLMLWFGVSLYHAIGTTMCIIFPIAVAGGLSYFAAGAMDMHLFVQTLMGLTLGAYVGAKFTRLIPKSAFHVIMVAIPCIGGIVMLLH